MATLQIRLDMPDVIAIDESARTVRAEPMVTIGQLNDFLVERGWTLPVVPELDDLTVGRRGEGRQGCHIRTELIFFGWGRVGRIVAWEEWRWRETGLPHV